MIKINNHSLVFLQSDKHFIVDGTRFLFVVCTVYIFIMSMMENAWFQLFNLVWVLWLFYKSCRWFFVNSHWVTTIPSEIIAKRKYWSCLSFLSFLALIYREDNSTFKLYVIGFVSVGKMNLYILQWFSPFMLSD